MNVVELTESDRQQIDECALNLAVACGRSVEFARASILHVIETMHPEKQKRQSTEDVLQEVLRRSKR